MTKNAKIWLVALILVVAGGVAFWLFRADFGAEPADTHEEEAVQASIVKDSIAADTIINYTDDGFDKTEYSVKAGGIVEIKNTSSRLLDFGSDPHPTHTDQPQLNVTDVEAGTSVKFKITAVGRWGFHNHLNPTEHSFITVE